MKVKFLSRQQPRTGRPEGDPVFEAGEVYDLREDQARKWVNRNVAEFVRSDAKPKESSPPQPEAEPKAAEKAPDAMTTADVKSDPTRAPSGDSDAAGATYKDMLREDLLKLIEKRDLELPPGYVGKDQLIEILKASGS